jgi:hypothetical protein
MFKNYLALGKRITKKIQKKILKNGPVFEEIKLNPDYQVYSY